jgi:hypothetical protein
MIAKFGLLCQTLRYSNRYFITAPFGNKSTKNIKLEKGIPLNVIAGRLGIT